MSKLLIAWCASPPPPSKGLALRGKEAQPVNQCFYSKTFIYVFIRSDTHSVTLKKGGLTGFRGVECLSWWSNCNLRGLWRIIIHLWIKHSLHAPPLIVWGLAPLVNRRNSSERLGLGGFVAFWLTKHNFNTCFTLVVCLQGAETNHRWGLPSCFHLVWWSSDYFEMKSS